MAATNAFELQFLRCDSTFQGLLPLHFPCFADLSRSVVVPATSAVACRSVMIRAYSRVPGATVRFAQGPKPIGYNGDLLCLESLEPCDVSCALGPNGAWRCAAKRALPACRRQA